MPSAEHAGSGWFQVEANPQGETLEHEPNNDAKAATPAQIPGIRVAGKTGTAETGVPGRYNGWFISFAPADHPKVAVAVVVENGGFGGHSAAPIAKALMQAILGRS